MSLLDVAREEAVKHGSPRVEAIHIRIGVLSGVVPEALQGAYELAREEAGMSDCRLVIEEVPVQVYCSKCEGERPVISLSDFRCQECGSPASQIVKGKELQVYALELDE